MGSMHPILFFVLVYMVALLLSVFICSSLFYSFHGSEPAFKAEKHLVSPG